MFDIPSTEFCDAREADGGDVESGLTLNLDNMIWHIHWLKPRDLPKRAIASISISISRIHG
jgi:hypothetical protein